MVYLLRHPLGIQTGAELDYDKVRRVLVRVVSTVVTQRVVDLKAQLTPQEVQCGAPHVAKEHLHCDLR